MKKKEEEFYAPCCGIKMVKKQNSPKKKVYVCPNPCCPLTITVTPKTIIHKCPKCNFHFEEEKQN